MNAYVIKERQKAGIVRAKAKGICVGRPKVDINDKFIKAYKLVESGEIAACQGMQLCGMKKIMHVMLVVPLTSI